MILNIIGTIISKVMIAVLSLLLVLITARYGGIIVRGEISLFVTNVAVVILFSNIIGGPSIVYLSTKVNTRFLVTIAYIWALISSVVVSTIILLSGFISVDLYAYLLIVSFFSCLFSVNSNLILGFQKIKAFNLLSLIQVISILIIVCYYFIFSGKSNLYSYVIALIGSSFFLCLLSIFYLIYTENINNNNSSKDLSYLAKTGFTAQMSNLIQFLNYRLSYYFIAIILSEKDLGLFSTCVILTESTWLISNSLSTVGYTKIAAEKNPFNINEITFKLFRLNLFLTLIPVIIIAVIPDKFYGYLLGPEFTNMKGLILIMLTGAFAISVHRMISTYFSGTGQFYLNNIASSIGLIGNCLLLYILLTYYQIVGAAIASTLIYLFMLIFSLTVFVRKTKISFSDLKLKKTDFDISY